MRVYYELPGKKLFVQLVDESGKPYGFIYDHKAVYVDNEGEIKCLKCLSLVKRLWNRDGTAGVCYCKECETSFRFQALGFGNVI